MNKFAVEALKKLGELTTRENAKLLIFLHFFLAIGAIGGGGILIISPNGDMAQLPVSLLDGSPFQSYLIPGILLFVVFGIIPIIIALGLMKRWEWQLAQTLNIFKQQYWAWTFSLYIGFALIIWITIQVAIIKDLSILHFIYIFYGLLIQLITLLPYVQSKYKMD